LVFHLLVTLAHRAVQDMASMQVVVEAAVIIHLAVAAKAVAVRVVQQVRQQVRLTMELQALQILAVAAAAEGVAVEEVSSEVVAVQVLLF
jgi:hypothetical protein